MFRVNYIFLTFELMVEFVERFLGGVPYRKAKSYVIIKMKAPKGVLKLIIER